MNKLFPLLVFSVFLCGCVQPEPEIILKYVCPDGAVVDLASDCPPAEDCDYESNCADYCEGGEPGPQPGLITVNYVHEEMDMANYCEVPEDCALADTKCPLGCYNVVNVEELERINGLVHDFKQTCFQTCTTLQDINCIANRCEPIAYGTS